MPGCAGSGLLLALVSHRSSFRQEHLQTLAQLCAQHQLFVDRKHGQAPFHATPLKAMANPTEVDFLPLTRNGSNNFYCFLLEVGTIGAVSAPQTGAGVTAECEPRGAAQDPADP